MTSFQSVPIQKDFSIFLVDKQLSFDVNTAEQIEEIWENAKKDHHRLLFDGTLISSVALNGDTLLVQRVPYKAYFAQTINPRLNLGIRPVSISCITQCEGRFLIGLRSSSVVGYPGRYEFAPSGGIDEKSVQDPKRQVYEELKEEVGITPIHVNNITPFRLVKNNEENTLELCFIVTLLPEALSIDQLPKAEYEEFMWLTREEVLAHIRQHHDEYVPVSTYLFNQFLS